jgi:hypothetical protein
MRYTVGIDLGQAFDYTAFAILEERKLRQYDLRHVERHRNVPYTVIVDRTRELVAQLRGNVSLAVDATGVGRPVVDMLEEARIGATLYALTLTGGDSVQREGRQIRVPKRDVVSSVACLLQTGRLRIPRSLPGAEVLERELIRFRAKITLSGHDTYEAWREADHDDLVLAVALGCWLNEKGRDGLLLYIQEGLDRLEEERR